MREHLTHLQKGGRQGNGDVKVCRRQLPWALNQRDEEIISNLLHKENISHMITMLQWLLTFSKEIVPVPATEARQTDSKKKIRKDPGFSRQSSGKRFSWGLCQGCLPGSKQMPRRWFPRGTWKVRSPLSLSKLEERRPGSHHSQCPSGSLVCGNPPIKRHCLGERILWK